MAIANWFMDYQITLAIPTETLDADTGFYTTTAPTNENTKTIACDVQPNTGEKLYDETGKLMEYDYQVFIDKKQTYNPFIKKEAIATYNNNQYSIKSIIEWDDYYILIIRRIDNV